MRLGKLPRSMCTIRMLAVVAVGGSAAVISDTSWAGHYHVAGSYGGSGQALVHGESTNDQIWHGRTTPAQVTGTHICGAGDDARGLVVVDQNNSSGNCTASLRADYFYTFSRECLSFGYADYPNAGIGEHIHRAHYYPTCPSPA